MEDSKKVSKYLQKLELARKFKKQYLRRLFKIVNRENLSNPTYIGQGNNLNGFNWQLEKGADSCNHIVNRAQ